jgi:branched-chain amino acid transport system ATP-binding protein
VTAPLLEARDLHTFYGASHVLHGVSLAVGRGETVTLMGRNGMGKTTTIRSVLGLTTARSGQVLVRGIPVSGWPAHRIARLGIALVPEGRGIFPALTVREHLVMAARPGRWTQERALELFPRLRERLGHLGSQLSGGEQQMLAVGRALMLRPRLMLLDEPSFGLAPLVVEELFGILRTLNRSEKVSMLLVEQNAALALDLADHAYLIETGRLVMEGPAQQLRDNENIRRAYLGY